MKYFLILSLAFAATSAFAAPYGAPDTSHMTCAQAQAYVKKHGTAVMATSTPAEMDSGLGDEWGSYSFTDCGGNPPGYACTLDKTYCYIGQYCDGVAGLTPPAGYYQGTEFCPARRLGK